MIPCCISDTMFEVAFFPAIFYVIWKKMSIGTDCFYGEVIDPLQVGSDGITVFLYLFSQH